MDQTGEAYADFGAVVSAKNGAVLNECHFAAQAGSAHCRAAPGRTATNGHEIKIPVVSYQARLTE